MGGGGAGDGGGAGSGAGGSSIDLPIECGEVPFLGECNGDSLRFCERSHYAGDASIPARVVSRSCGEGSTCALRDNTAFCAPTSLCLAGQTGCSAEDAVAICSVSSGESAFSSSSCDPGARCVDAGVAATCAPPPIGAEVLAGCVTYERRLLTAESFGELVVAPAPYLAVAVYEEGASNVLGAAKLDARGCFEVALSARPSADVVVHLTAFVPRADEGNDLDDSSPLVAVAHLSPPASTPSGFASTGYWEWSNRDTSCGDDTLFDRAVVLDADGPGRHRLGRVDHDLDAASAPDLIIREACGSGAIHILRRLREAMARVTRNHLTLGDKPSEIVRRTEKLSALSVLGVWEPGLEQPCGSCTSATNTGPYSVPVGAEGSDDFDLAIWVGGTAATPSHWASSVLSHEMGHWAMASYSRTPGEGGTHYAASPSKPGLAYLEGWATAFGQWNLGSPSAGIWDPRYVDRQGNTTFYLDIAKMTWTNGTLPTLAPGAPVDAPINENAVAAMIFALAAPASVIPHGQDLTADAWFRTLVSPRLNGSLGRGYFRTDLLDFFDAGRCSGALPDASIVAVTAPQNYPWDHDPLCDP